MQSQFYGEIFGHLTGVYFTDRSINYSNERYLQLIMEESTWYEVEIFTNCIRNI